jgi:hypothetical protein
VTAPTSILKDRYGTDRYSSFEVWVRRTGDVFGEYILDTRDADGLHGYAIYQDDQGLKAKVFSSSVLPPCEIAGPSLNSFDTGVWHHILFWNDGKGHLHVDGYSQGNTDCPSNPYEAPIRVGEAFDGSSKLKNLDIDNLRINFYPTFAGGTTFDPDPTPSAMGSDAFWSFSEGAGEVAIDEVSGLSLQLTNHQWVPGM